MSEPVVLELKDGVRFPKVCAHCAAPASRRILVQQRFYGSEDPYTGSISPYFCDSCIAAHRREVPPPSIWTQLRYLLFNQLAVPAILFGIATLWLMKEISKAALQQDGKIVLLYAVLATVCGLISIGSAIGAYRTAQSSYIEKLSTITSSVLFSDDRSELFEPAWRRYTFLNPAYAEQVAKLNADLIWDRKGKEADRAFTLRFYGKWLLYAAIAVLVAYWIYDDYIKGFL